MTHYLDRRFRRVGRIKRSAGTEHPPTIKLLNGMLDGLYARGRMDILKEIQRGYYTPLQVWELYRINELERLPNARTLAPLLEGMQNWVAAKECSDFHKLSIAQSIRYIEKKARAGTTTTDLPIIVEELRSTLPARSFNLLRSHAQAYLKATVKRSHPLYLAVLDTEPRKVVPVRAKRPLTPTEMREEIEKLETHHRDSAWSMALSGMRPVEYWGHWNQLPDRIRIRGGKGGKIRFVPLVRPIAVPRTTERAFALALQHRIDLKVTPYDFRRTYANWMEAAGIIRTRRKLYMGHGKGDVTDLYERHEVDAFLVEDAEKLRRFIGATQANALQLVNRA